MFKAITHGEFFIYIKLGIIMHWVVKWHKEHEDLTVLVLGLLGLLMDTKMMYKDIDGEYTLTFLLHLI